VLRVACVGRSLSIGNKVCIDFYYLAIHNSILCFLCICLCCLLCKAWPYDNVYYLPAQSLKHARLTILYRGSTLGILILSIFFSLYLGHWLSNITLLMNYMDSYFEMLPLKSFLTCQSIGRLGRRMKNCLVHAPPCNLNASYNDLIDLGRVWIRSVNLCMQYMLPKKC